MPDAHKPVSAEETDILRDLLHHEKFRSVRDTTLRLIADIEATRGALDRTAAELASFVTEDAASPQDALYLALHLLGDQAQEVVARSLRAGYGLAAAEQPKGDG
jgi:hypothetical protein